MAVSKEPMLLDVVRQRIHPKTVRAIHSWISIGKFPILQTTADDAIDGPVYLDHFRAA